MTSSAARAQQLGRVGTPSVVTIGDLAGLGWTWDAAQAQVTARRWQRVGNAYVRHNGPLSWDDRCLVALLSAGPRAVLTSFTTLQAQGLTTWERDAIHLLVPRGARLCLPDGVQIKVHYARDWKPEAVMAARRLHRVPPAAASAPRRSPTLGMGAGCLPPSCSSAGLPTPDRQRFRNDKLGKRRYLDAEFTTRTGRTLIAEVDGALHMVPRRWWDDELRRNELVIGDEAVLRFPSAVVRCEKALVVDQLRRALLL